jgi:LPXTG-site transpeptidase (sortase) family protein
MHSMIASRCDREATAILPFKLKPAYMMLGVAMVFAAATVVTTFFGGNEPEPDAFKTIDASPPGSAVAPARLPGAEETLAPVPSLVRLIIPALQIDAPIVAMSTRSDGTMQAPRSPFDVAWYMFSAVPGHGSNVVLAGHAEYVNHGPAVFASMPFIRSGDQIQVLLPDATLATYVVSSAETYDAATAPVAAITGPTNAEVVTLITTGIPGDTSRRLVVRGDRVIEGALSR